MLPPVMRPPARVTAVLAAAAFTVLGMAWARAMPTLFELVRALPLACAHTFRALPGLVLVLVVGRIVLALLPAGPLGSLRPRDLPTTLAASFLFGLVGTTLGPLAFGDPRAPGLGLAFWPWLGLGTWLWWSGPGAMVPRHEPAHERETAGSRALRFGCALLVLLVFALVGVEPVPPPLRTIAAGELPLLAVPLALLRRLAFGELGAEAARRLVLVASWMALLVLVARALADGRRAPVDRRTVVLAGFLVLVPFAELVRGTEATLSAVFLGAGCACAVPWLRRADRRARHAALIAFAACGWAGRFELGLLGIVVLVFATAAPARKALVSAVPYVLVVAATGALTGLEATFGCEAGRLIRDAGRPFAWGLFWVFAGGAALLAGVVLVRRPQTPASAIDEPRREQVLLSALLLLGFLLPDPRAAELLVLFPPALLLIGFTLARTERVNA